jgi:hypothetical protein
MASVNDNKKINSESDRLGVNSGSHCIVLNMFNNRNPDERRPGTIQGAVTERH